MNGNCLLALMGAGGAFLVFLLFANELLKAAEYWFGPVDYVLASPNRRQEDACEPGAARPPGDAIRMVDATVVSEPLHGALGIRTPRLELDARQSNLILSVPGVERPVFLHGMPDRDLQPGDSVRFCGAFTGEPAFHWPLAGFEPYKGNLLIDKRSGGPAYGPPSETRYQRVLWVAPGEQQGGR